LPFADLLIQVKTTTPDKQMRRQLPACSPQFRRLEKSEKQLKDEGRLSDNDSFVFSLY